MIGVDASYDGQFERPLGQRGSDHSPCIVDQRTGLGAQMRPQQHKDAGNKSGLHHGVLISKVEQDYRAGGSHDRGFPFAVIAVVRVAVASPSGASSTSVATPGGQLGGDERVGLAFVGVFPKSGVSPCHVVGGAACDNRDPLAAGWHIGGNIRWEGRGLTQQSGWLMISSVAQNVGLAFPVSASQLH